MTNKSRIKTIIIFLFLAAFSVALYLTSQRQKWDLGWGKGLLSISERKYYSNRINRIIEYWQQTRYTVKHERNGKLDESYNTYLVVDLNKKAMWIEENGQMCTENYIDFPPKTKWTFYRSFPGGNTELLGKTMLKIRDSGGKYITPESFYLVGNGTKGYIASDFSSKNTYYNPGSFKVRSYKLPTYDVNDDERFGSMVVTEDEYKQYLDTLHDSNAVVVENEKIKAWNKIEKHLYMEVEGQILKTGYRLGNVSIEPGPDFSAARAQINVDKVNFMGRTKGLENSFLIYQNIDHIGNDIWYAKSIPSPYPDPSKTAKNKPVLDIEFLASPNGFIKGSKREELLKKGREFQKAPAIPESKWKATLPDGTIVEFLGIRENRSKDSLWWGPDGSLIDYVPNYNTKPMDRFFKLRIIYEMAWRVTPHDGLPYTLEGCTDIYGSNSIDDRYGYVYNPDHFVEGFYFEPSRQVTTMKIGYGGSGWKTALEIKDEEGEINFLDKYQVMIKPPTIEQDKLVIHCYYNYRALLNYVTDFAMVVNDGSETKTISLHEFSRIYNNRKEKGLSDHAYNIKDYDISQIESVCFRYRPYGAIFKNISLVPGEDFGFEIEVIEAEKE